MSVASIKGKEQTLFYHHTYQSYHGKRLVLIYLSGKRQHIFSLWTITPGTEISKLSHLTANAIVTHTKSIFARHGIPEVVYSDNGPQFQSSVYSQFALAYQFNHITSSPYFPQRNGEAERAVATIKNLLKKEGDPYLALLAYRSTPWEIGFSPSQLLMGRTLRSTIPTIREQ